MEATKSGIDKNKIVDAMGLVPYVTRTESSNGIQSFIGAKQEDKYKPDAGNVITIGLDTQTVFYQVKPFYTGQNIQVLSHPEINRYNAMFIIPLLKKQMAKFNWGGNGATLGRLNKTSILLPITSSSNPDWDAMTDYAQAQETLVLMRQLCRLE
nr:restriction endonuclease subunit S [Actinomyces sp. S4-C9]